MIHSVNLRICPLNKNLTGIKAIKVYKRPFSFLFLLVICFFCHNCIAQTISAREWYGNARSMAMGDAMLIAQSLLSDNNYQSQQKKKLNVERVMAGYRMPYAQPALAVWSLLFQVRSPLADFQLNMGKSGDNDFNETLLGLACSRSVSESVSGGFRLGTYRVAGSQLQNGTALLTECFVYYLLNSQWRLGAYMFNPIAARASGIRLVQSYHLACAYRPDHNLDFVLEMEKQQRQAIQIHMGMESQLFKRLQFRFGLNYPLMQASLGLGFCLKKFSLDVACRLHQNLPPSYALSLQFSP